MSHSHDGSWDLTAGQLGIWYAHKLNEDKSLHNIGEYLEITGDLDLVLFEEALRRTIEEADVLHARFIDGDEGVRQRFVPIADWSLPVIDVSSASDPCAE